MHKKIGKCFLYSFISVVVLGVFIYCEEEDLTVLSTVFGVALAYALEIAWNSFKDCFDNSTWKETLRLYIRKQLINKEDYIRISFAYLFRINVDGKYMLVRNGRGTKKYQPVGGAYQTTDNEKLHLKDVFSVTGDNKIPIDEYSKNDYRMFVPAKNLRKFVKRFNKTKDRELVSDLGREFKEELVETGILDFDNIEYRYCGRHMTNIAFSRHFQCYELLLADVVELIPTKEQEEKLRTLMKLDSEKYIWANEDEIKHCGIVEGSEQLEETIGDHTFKILEETEIKLNCIKKLKGRYPVAL